MIRRLGVVVAAVGVVLGGWMTGSAAAEPACADYHWIGAAGSGQRDAASVAADEGMGDVVFASLQDLRSEVESRGQTLSSEAVAYPAAPVPLDGGIGGWLAFLDSVNVGTAAVARQYAAYTATCPTSKVVLAGYSQGAMIVHRNLYGLAADPRLVAALLVADGDRLPVDTTVDLGTTAVTPGLGMGVAQDYSVLAGTNTSPLPPAMGARTVSVCDIGDPVCDYSDATDTLSPAAIAIHTSYAPDVQGWSPVLDRLVTGGTSA